MKIENCFFTSFNKAYAAQAILMAESIRMHHGPDAKIYAVMVDKLTSVEKKYFDVFDEIIDPEDLNIPNFKAWIFGLDIIEAATAVKPFALCYLLERYTQVTYLDPDTCVYSKLDEILDPSTSWDIALTPHQIEPKIERWLIESTELESLRFGAFNLGFLSVRSTENGKYISNWWRDRCYEYCISEPERGLFTDQKFFDLAPALFKGVFVLRHSGYNVASWNLRERYIEFKDETLCANGLNLRFCHYTKASHIGALALERMLTDGNFFLELFYIYIQKLIEKRAVLIDLNLKWHYGFFNDGSQIDDQVRVNFRNFSDRFQYQNPFANTFNFDNISN
jgi:hypothetical protein